MIMIKTDYVGQLGTEATHVQSSNKIIKDVPLLTIMEKVRHFLPQIWLLGALCSCMMTIMGIMARRKGFDLDGINGEVTKVMVSDPHRISEVHINFIWSNPPEDEVMRTRFKRDLKGQHLPVLLH